MPWWGGISTAKLSRSSTEAKALPVNMSDIRPPPGGQVLGADCIDDVLIGEVENDELVPARAPVGGRVRACGGGDLREVDLAAGGDAVVGAHPQDGLQLPQEAGFVDELLGDGSVKASPTGHSCRQAEEARLSDRLLGPGTFDIHQHLGTAVTEPEDGQRAADGAHAGKTVRR